MTEMFAGQDFSQGIKTIFYSLLRHVRMCIIMNKMIKNEKEIKDADQFSEGVTVHSPSDRRMQ